MTNKEAIEELKKVDTLDMPARLCEAHYMAIKALEQEPCGDLISRQAVQDYIAEYLSQYLYNDVREAVEVIDEYIGELPSVNPQEPKTGHWSHDGSHWKNRFICSGCGYKLFDEPTNYCPNCGCRMFEPQESEEQGMNKFRYDLLTIEDDIRKELKSLRKHKSINQETMGIYLAKQIGKDKPIIKAQIYNYECGKNHITFPVFVGWCKVCDSNPGEVLNRIVGNAGD